MGKAARRGLWLLVIVALLAPAYYFLAVHSPAKGTPFELDLAQLRTMANTVPGDKPTEVRYEHVMSMTFSEAMLMAGDPWKASPMPVYSYQLVFPQQTILVDTALSREIMQPQFLVSEFHEDAYQRMLDGMTKATQIFITHEHMDHIGGIAAHPSPASIKNAVKLTGAQLNNPKGMEPAKLPAELTNGYAPLTYDKLHSPAPGVVLIKSPGHTPGAQMVFVQLADGRELLFLGDVSWRLRNIEQVRERPLFMTLMIGEDRDLVMGEFEALNALMKSAPAVKLVPGHDGPAMQALTQENYLVPGFKLSP